MDRQRSSSLSETGSETGLRALFRSGTAEIVDGALQWRLWYLIGSSEMRRRYARSRLGQIWIMLTSAIAVSTIGFVWSYLWALPVGEVLPYIAVGLVVWQLIAAILIEFYDPVARQQPLFSQSIHARLHDRVRAGVSTHRDVFHEPDLSADSCGKSGPSPIKLSLSCHSGGGADPGLVFVDVPDPFPFCARDIGTSSRSSAT